MGEYADMTLDDFEVPDNDSSPNWDGDEPWADKIIYNTRRHKSLICKYCQMPNLKWRLIKDQWTMFESDIKVHTCVGYTPVVEVLKELADQILEKGKRESVWKLREEFKQRGNLLKLVTVIPDEQLIDLYACFIRDNQGDVCYDRHIKIIRKEVLRRIQE